MTPPVQKQTRIETCIGGAILLLLAVIAAGVVRKQSTFNPAVLTSRDINASQPVAQQPVASAILSLSDGLAVLSAPEQFTPDNLYDKIDGKAELYLSAGFVQMRCQRFSLKDAPDQWFEWFAYNMGTVPQSFSVFSLQRRSEGKPSDLTEYAYQTRNALYFVCGSNYVEAVASAPSEPLMRAMTLAARNFVASSAAAPAQLPQLELLPTDDLVPGSFSLQSSDVFGFDGFKDVFTAQYTNGGVELMAFVTTCSNSEVAVSLSDAYRAFLLANGGKEVAAANNPFGKAIVIMDNFEFVFSDGKFVAGIHSSPAIPPAERLAKRLRERLDKVHP